jgi:diacylglycerol O-acyltransferase
MPRYAYERLSAQDAALLWSEKPNQPMHVGGLAVLEAEPVKRPDGSIDIDCYRSRIESVLHWIPRYRQKLEWTPIEGWPVWVDDRQFDLGYHIRHIALPRPGTTEQLKEMAARINARALDRRHALWEIWLIEGVAGGDQFALLNKIHHCMIDGAAGADLSQILLSPSPRVELSENVPYMPRPVPTQMELWRDSLALGVSRPLGLLRNVFNARSTTPDDEVPGNGDEKSSVGGPSIERRLRSLKGMLTQSLGSASATPLNGELSPHRRLEWLTMPLDDVKELRRALDCTVNDVVLATVTEAVRRYLFRRRVDHQEIDFRVSAPVSMRRPEHDRRQGNHVSSWVVRLPLDREDPLEQLSAIRELTSELKRSEASLAVDTLMEVAEWVPGPILARGLGAVSSAGPVNMVVTNVPGPQFPLYMVGAKLLGLYPIVPLLPGGGLGVALFSYEGKLCWGFNGDYELVPDLAAFVDDVRVAFENLRNAAVARYMERRTALAELPDVLDLTQSALMSVEVQPGDEVEKQEAPVHAAGIG